MNWLLVFFPIAIVLETFAPERPLFVFIASSLAILPLAGWMGRSTEQLANRMGEGVGGLQGARVPISRATFSSESSSSRSWEMQLSMQPLYRQH